MPDEDAVAAKRREVEEKVAALKLLRKKEEEQRTNFFGEHPGISCDGCGAKPLVGYRYHCKNCPNHDVCESCYDAWKGGTGTMTNGLHAQVPHAACLGPPARHAAAPRQSRAQRRVTALPRATPPASARARARPVLQRQQERPRNPHRRAGHLQRSDRPRLRSAQGQGLQAAGQGAGRRRKGQSGQAAKAERPMRLRLGQKVQEVLRRGVERAR